MREETENRRVTWHPNPPTPSPPPTLWHPNTPHLRSPDPVAAAPEAAEAAEPPPTPPSPPLRFLFCPALASGAPPPCRGVFTTSFFSWPNLAVPPGPLPGTPTPICSASSAKETDLMLRLLMTREARAREGRVRRENAPQWADRIFQ